MKISEPVPLPARRSLRIKFLVPLMAMTAAVGGFGAWFLHLDSSQKQHHAIMQRAAMLINTVNYAAPLMTDEDLRLLIVAQGKTEGIKKIVLAAGTPQRVIASTQADGINLPVSRLEDIHAAHLLEKAAHDKQDIYHFFDDESELHFVHALPPLKRHINDIEFANPAVLVFMDASRIRRDLIDESRFLGAGLFVLLFLLGGFSYLHIYSLVLKPVAQMSEALSRLQAGNRHVRIPVSIDNEIGQVAQRLNYTLDEHESALIALSESEARHRLLADNASDFILIYGRDLRVCYANAALQQALGFGRANFQEHELQSILTQQSFNPSHQNITEATTFEIELNGSYGALPVEAMCTPLIYNGEVKEILLIGRDIRERKASEARIQHLAYHDMLTGLPNRLLLQDRFEQALAHAERNQTQLALFFIDLDQFKTINDSWGHNLGDQLLIQIGERLSTCLRAGDTLARQGGDEFIVLLPDIFDVHSVMHVAEKLLTQTKEPYALGEYKISVTFSLGVSLFPSNGKDMETLMEKADIAMYHAKSQGRNAYRFYSQACLRQPIDHQEHAA